MLTIGIVGLAIDAGIRALTRRTLPWSLAMAK
jgi:ABC-type nitrate/sulfonate/bicarbonate transport system permease component